MLVDRFVVKELRLTSAINENSNIEKVVDDGDNNNNNISCNVCMRI